MSKKSVDQKLKYIIGTEVNKYNIVYKNAPADLRDCARKCFFVNNKDKSLSFRGYATDTDYWKLLVSMIEHKYGDYITKAELTLYRNLSLKNQDLGKEKVAFLNMVTQERKEKEAFENEVKVLKSDLEDVKKENTELKRSIELMKEVSKGMQNGLKEKSFHTEEIEEVIDPLRPKSDFLLNNLTPTIHELDENNNINYKSKCKEYKDIIMKMDNTIKELEKEKEKPVTESSQLRINILSQLLEAKKNEVLDFIREKEEKENEMRDLRIEIDMLKKTETSSNESDMKNSDLIEELKEKIKNKDEEIIRKDSEILNKASEIEDLKDELEKKSSIESSGVDPRKKKDEANYEEKYNKSLKEKETLREKYEKDLEDSETLRKKYEKDLEDLKIQNRIMMTTSQTKSDEDPVKKFFEKGYDEYRGKFDDANFKLGKLESKISSCKENNKKLEESSSKISKELEDVKESFSRLEEKANTHKIGYDDILEKYKAVSVEKGKLENELESLKLNNTKLENSEKKISKELEDLKINYNVVLDNAEKNKKGYDDILKKIGEVNVQKGHVEAENKNLNYLMDEADKSKKDLDIQVKKLTENNKSLLEDIGKVTRNVAVLSKNNNDLKVSCESYRKKMNEYWRDLKTSSGKFKKLEENMNNKKEEIEKLNTEVKKLAQYKNGYEKCVLQMNNAINETSKLQKMYDDLLRTLNSYEESINDVKKGVSEMKESVDNCVTNVLVVENRVTGAVNNLSNCTSKIVDSTNKNIQISSNERKRINDLLDGEFKKKEKKIKEIDNDVKTQATTIVLLTADLKTRTDEKNGLEKVKFKLEGQNKNLETAKVELNKFVATLNGRITELEVKSKEKDIIIEKAHDTIKTQEIEHGVQSVDAEKRHKIAVDDLSKKLSEKNLKIEKVSKEKEEMKNTHIANIQRMENKHNCDLKKFSADFTVLTEEKKMELLKKLALDLKYKEEKLEKRLRVKKSELKEMTNNRDEEGRKYLNAQRLLDEEFKNKVLPGEVHLKLTLALDELKKKEENVTTLVKEIRDEFSEVVKSVGVTKIIPGKFVVKNHSSVPQTKCIGKSSSGVIEEIDEDNDVKFTCILDLSNGGTRKDLVYEGFENEFKMRNLTVFVNDVPVDWEMSALRGFSWILPVQFRKVGKYAVKYVMYTYVKENQRREVNYSHQFVLNIVPCNPVEENCIIQVIRKVKYCPRIFKADGSVVSVGSAEGNFAFVEKQACCGEDLFIHVQLRNEKNEIIKKRNTTVLFSSTDGSMEEFKFAFAEEDYDEEEQKYKTPNPINIPIAGTFRISLVDIGTVFELEITKPRRISFEVAGDLSNVADLCNIMSERIYMGTTNIGIFVDFFEFGCRRKRKLPRVDCHFFLMGRALAPLIDDIGIHTTLDKFSKNSNTKSAVYVHLVPQMQIKEYIRRFGRPIKTQDDTFPSGLFLGILGETFLVDLYFAMNESAVVTDDALTGFNSQVDKVLNMILKMDNFKRRNAKRNQRRN